MSHVGQCEVILVHNCFDQALFAITESFSQSRLSIGLLVPMYLIELNKDSFEGPIVLKVNGLIVDTVIINNPLTLREDQNDEL